MTRQFCDLKLRCIILGGGWAIRKNDPLPKTYLDKNVFYTVDINPEQNPDAVFDFTIREAWSAFPDSSFDFIIFEAVPFVEGIQIAFEECRRILSDTGVVFYRGGCKAQESMMEIFRRADYSQVVLYIPPVVSEELVNYFKMEQGMLSFASKSRSVLTQEYMQQHLPKLALEAVRFNISDITKNMAEMSVNQIKYSKTVDSAIHFSHEFLFGGSELKESKTTGQVKKVSQHAPHFWSELHDESLTSQQENTPICRLCPIL